MAESFPLKIIFDAVNRTAPAFQSIGNNLDQLKRDYGEIKGYREPKEKF
jgi:hypothetical protein